MTEVKRRLKLVTIPLSLLATIHDDEISWLPKRTFVNRPHPHMRIPLPMHISKEAMPQLVSTLFWTIVYLRPSTHQTRVIVDKNFELMVLGIQ